MIFKLCDQMKNTKRKVTPYAVFFGGKPFHQSLTLERKIECFADIFQISVSG